VPAGSGITVPSIATFVSGFYVGGCMGHLSDSCHRSVTDM